MVTSNKSTDLEELAADGAAGGIGQVGGRRRDAAQTSAKAIGAIMVAVEVRSANRSIWHSLMRFSISPRAQ
jgi:hypothetical protein